MGQARLDKGFIDMNLSESYIKRLKSLSGIRLNEIELRASSGRSDKGTLSYFVEDYILKLGETFIDSLDQKVKQTQSMSLVLEQGSIKISQNSLLLKFKIEDRTNPKDVALTEYSLNINVNLESSANTSAVLKYSNLIDEFNLQSKHSERDVADFVEEIANRALNVQRIAG